MESIKINILAALQSALILLSIASCTTEEFNRDVEIPNFNYPTTTFFQDSLSSYNIFKGDPSNLLSTEGFELIELSSILFTDYAYKQRLLKIPIGTQMIKLSDGSMHFPNGTILTKTFFYYNDERDYTLGKRIIETRLEIKENDIWNVATYIWNEDQTDAILNLNGSDTQITWIDGDGINRSTLYHIPSKDECITCHQSNSTLSPLGPTLLNINLPVNRNGSDINQIQYLQNIGILNLFSIDQIGQMVDYNDRNAPLKDRGRAYLAMNCAHCHNPSGWDRANEREFDFRYNTAINHTGILFEKDKIKTALENREMPLIGTTLMDVEGIELIIEYLDQL